MCGASNNAPSRETVAKMDSEEAENNAGKCGAVLPQAAPSHANPISVWSCRKMPTPESDLPRRELYGRNVEIMA